MIPAAPYLQALGFEKDQLVQALGLSFATSTLALAAGLASRSAFHISEAWISTFCLIPALAGMAIGKSIRARVSQATFRLIFLSGLLLLGGSIIAHSTL